MKLEPFHRFRFFKFCLRISFRGSGVGGEKSTGQVSGTSHTGTPKENPQSELNKMKTAKLF